MLGPEQKGKRAFMSQMMIQLVENQGVLTTVMIVNMETMEDLEDLILHQNTQMIQLVENPGVLTTIMIINMETTEDLEDLIIHQNTQKVASEGINIHLGVPSLGVVVLVMLKPEPSGPSTVIMTMIRTALGGLQDSVHKIGQMALAGCMVTDRTSRWEQNTDQLTEAVISISITCSTCSRIKTKLKVQQQRLIILLPFYGLNARYVRERIWQPYNDHQVCVFHYCKTKLQRC